ncbi:N-acetyltransferase [Dokdonia sinensis]|uniref:N-acetyltransferase n=1 Tax=Dokdonia sinensis TaxID=2479847 RepID=A0A3M0G7H6_9FLAO|nr:GNAT family protein [Dokdonia sinensis]RMB56989.1 N-acetyltransferase [Dokdonia sinensis]
MKAKILQNDRARLLALETFHFPDLLPLSKQVDLHKYGASDISSPDKLRKYMNDAFAKREEGLSLPFIIFDKKYSSFAGCTRFGNIDRKNKTVHIGWTWLGKDFRGSGLNQHIKFLMLRYAFEKLSFEKVEFRIDERNTQSRKAVEKIGATLEGILRKDIITKSGIRRSSCCYGILREEWPEIKATKFKDL